MNTVNIDLDEYLGLKDIEKKSKELKNLVEQCPIGGIYAVQINHPYSSKRQEYLKIELTKNLLENNLNVYYERKYNEALDENNSLTRVIREKEERIRELEFDINRIKREYNNLSNKYNNLKDNIPSSFIDFIKYKLWKKKKL